MKKFFALVAVGLLILGAASCNTKNVGIFGGNHAPVINSATFNAVDDTLTVALTDMDATDIVTVTCSVPAGLAVDNPKTFSKSGNVVFHWTATDTAAGGTGTTTVTATDTAGAFATATAVITVDPVVVSAVSITSHVYTMATQTLAVVVADTNNADVTVAVTSPTGLTPDAASKTVTGGNGTATFTWTGAADATGDTTITATEGANTATATQTITIPAIVNDPPVITTHNFVDNANGTGTLTVHVTDAQALDTVTVSVSDVAGMTHSVVGSADVTGGAGDVVFTFTATDQTVDTSGTTTITANDAHNPDVTATQALTIAAVVAANLPPTITSHVYTEPTLAVVVADAEDPVTVTVSVPAGLAVDNATPPATAALGGTVNFIWSAVDPFAGGAGDTTITISDGHNPDVTATQHITITAWPLVADTLYARPAAPTAAVGQPVTVFVYTSQVPNQLTFLSSVGVTVENAGSYVASTFNTGAAGGARGDTDGYWALLRGTPDPPGAFPANSTYLDLGDGLMPGAATDIGGGLHRYNFAIVTSAGGPFTPPAAIGTGTGPFLFSFQLTFSAAGTYHLGFQLNDGSFDQTYYSDNGGLNYFWGTLDNSNTITVN